MEKITHSIKEYIEKNGKRANLHWRVTSSGAKFKHNGRWYGLEMLNNLYPKYQYKYQYKQLNTKGENPNTKSLL
jgi:hypothetical protein